MFQGHWDVSINHACVGGIVALKRHRQEQATCLLEGVAAEGPRVFRILGGGGVCEWVGGVCLTGLELPCSPRMKLCLAMCLSLGGLRMCQVQLVSMTPGWGREVPQPQDQSRMFPPREVGAS